MLRESFKEHLEAFLSLRKVKKTSDLDYKVTPKVLRDIEDFVVVADEEMMEDMEEDEGYFEVSKFVSNAPDSKDIFIVGKEENFFIFNEKKPVAFINVYEGEIEDVLGDWLVFSGSEGSIGFNLKTFEIKKY